MILLPLLLQVATPPAAPALPRAADQQPRATVMAEPVTLAIAGWDADGDGRTTAAELRAGAARGFAAVDREGRGSVSYIGYADWSERWLGDRSALPSPFEVDGDADDRITAAELDAALDRVFARLDRDRDGAVSRAEMLTIRSGLTDPGRRGRGGGRPADGGGR